MIFQIPHVLHRYDIIGLITAFELAVRAKCVRMVNGSSKHLFHTSEFTENTTDTLSQYRIMFLPTNCYKSEDLLYIWKSKQVWQSKEQIDKEVKLERSITIEILLNVRLVRGVSSQVFILHNSRVFSGFSSFPKAWIWPGQQPWWVMVRINWILLL